jgi:CxxC-x17-CxxC domain-containing protein
MKEPMSCNEWSQRLEAGIDHLSPDDRQALEAHINTCSACALLFTEYGRITGLLCHLPVPELPDGLPPLLLQQWEEEQKEETRKQIIEWVSRMEERHRKAGEQRKGQPQYGKNVQREEETQYQAKHSDFVDQMLLCCDCGSEFLFTAGEQEFYQSKGLVNAPDRCPSCRAARRTAAGSGRSRAESSSSRSIYMIPCPGCGQKTLVPFLPKSGYTVTCAHCAQIIYTRG